MILGKGKSWIQIDDTNAKFAELCVQLRLAERYLHLKNWETASSDYWGLCRDNPDENVMVNLDGKTLCGRNTPLGVTYEDVMTALPRLADLMDELCLHPYIGHNSIGNWGIHRHAYSHDSKWNLCVMGEGNDPATVAFHRQINGPAYEDLADTHIYDLLDKKAKTEIVEALEVFEGEMYSFETWQWHSHTVKRRNNKVECFLLHFKGADTQEKTLEILRRGNQGFWGKVIGFWGAP